MGTGNFIRYRERGTALNGGSFGDCYLAGFKGALYGGMSAIAAVGIGDIIQDVGLIAKSKFLTEAVRTGAHSVTQGAITVLRGGDFWQGAASGALGSIGASIYGGDNLWITMAVSSVSGGVGAVIGGARSAEEILFGMATGAIVGALNYGMHEAGEEKVDASKLKITYSKKGVQIDNTDKYTIRAALKHPNQVAAIAKQRYLQKYGVKLNISNSSLSNEIMYHAIAYKINDMLHTNIMKDNARIANCGETDAPDHNRWIWDSFSGMN